MMDTSPTEQPNLDAVTQDPNVQSENGFSWLRPFGDPNVEGDGWAGWLLPQPGSAPLVELPDVNAPLVEVDFTPIAFALGLVVLSAVAVYAGTRR